MQKERTTPSRSSRLIDRLLIMLCYNIGLVSYVKLKSRFHSFFGIFTDGICFGTLIIIIIIINRHFKTPN